MTKVVWNGVGGYSACLDAYRVLSAKISYGGSP